MMQNDVEAIIREAIANVIPFRGVYDTVKSLPQPKGKLILVAIGKASWEMAEAAYEFFGALIDSGIVITKYNHSRGPIGDFQIFEAGHPTPDNNSFLATTAVLNQTENLSADDIVLFLISGGGSALFEKPLIPWQELTAITNQLLSSGANITEINTIRKRLSAVKGGKFAVHCAPAQIYSLVLSDVLGNPLDVIASGPAYPDSTTAEDALKVVDNYKLRVSPKTMNLFSVEPPKTLNNVQTVVIGSLKQLCDSAEKICKDLGFRTVRLTTYLDCEASEAGKVFSAIAKEYAEKNEKIAFIAGGETVVHIKGTGKGGRNQEMALATAIGIKSLRNVVFFSVGSDGTDGPTDAAGGVVDGYTYDNLLKHNIVPEAYLENNDSYHALDAVGCLIQTGPTGTNVNDLSVLLVYPK